MKGHKHRLELNNKQFSLANKHAGTARHAYNWGLNLCFELQEKGEALPSSIDLHKLLVKNVKSKNKWYYGSSKCSPQQSLRNLSEGWRSFFRKLNNGEVEKKRKSYINCQKKKGRPVKQKTIFNMCKPKFKKKGFRDSFYLEGRIIIKGNQIKLPKFGWVKMSESYENAFEVKNVVVSRQADYFFVSFKTEFSDTKIKGISQKKAVGVDLGVKSLATISDGMVFENIKAFNRYKGRLRREQKTVSRRYNKGAKAQSNNYHKAQAKVAKLHYKVSCARKDSIHKLTTYLAKNHSQIVIEDLNVSGMMKNRRLAGAIQDGGFYEFRRQLEYKAKWYGSEVKVVDRFFPSSKTCSCCKNVNQDLKLSDRIYHCKDCGLKIDRDLNAAINIKDYAVSSTVKACGELNKPPDNLTELVESGNKHQYAKKCNYV